jgi:hypothetical protein
MTSKSFVAPSTDFDAPPPAEFGPSSRFGSPRELLTDASLTQEEKLELLTEWEEDIRLALVAAEEGMNGVDDVQLREVLSAKGLLTPDAVRPNSPSKS